MGIRVAESVPHTIHVRMGRAVGGRVLVDGQVEVCNEINQNIQVHLKQTSSSAHSRNTSRRSACAARSATSRVAQQKRATGRVQTHRSFGQLLVLGMCFGLGTLKRGAARMDGNSVQRKRILRSDRRLGRNGRHRRRVGQIVRVHRRRVVMRVFDSRARGSCHLTTSNGRRNVQRGARVGGITIGAE